MSNKFLHTSENLDLGNGSINILASSLGSTNLIPNLPIKANTNKQLYSTKLEISDINNLQSELDDITGSGVIGPASSTTNAIVRYADTTGKLLKNSTVTLSDDGGITGVAFTSVWRFRYGAKFYY